MVFYYLSKNFFILILSLGDSGRFFGSVFDSKFTTRPELSVPTLGIESPRLSGRVDTNRQDSGRVPDPNSMTRPDAISLG
jgi:hypothetical protein